MSNIEYLYRYTSLESLALILKSRQIRLNPLDKMDDLQEQKTADVENLGKFVFISSWTEESDESIPMWRMYTDPRAGVRIKMRKNPFVWHGTKGSIPCSQSAGRGIFISSSLESTDLLDIATAASWLRPYLCVVQMCNCFLSSDEGRNSLSISNQALNRYWSTVIIPLGLHIHNEACDAFAFKLRIALCAKSIAYFLFIINVIVFHSQGKLMILKIKNPALKGKINQYA